MSEESEMIKELTDALELALSFAPRGAVPEGLAPMFYHTLNYEDEVKLQNRIDRAHVTLAKARETLSKGDENV